MGIIVVRKERVSDKTKHLLFYVWFSEPIRTLLGIYKSNEERKYWKSVNDRIDFKFNNNKI